MSETATLTFDLETPEISFVQVEAAGLDAETATGTIKKSYVKSEIADGLRIGLVSFFILCGIAGLVCAFRSAGTLVPHSAEVSRVAAMFAIAWCAISVPGILYFAVKKSLRESLSVSTVSMAVLGLMVGIVGL
jgi:hypothetical protein